ncbi:hypothetical protein [Bifidobacterium leontopitheci]|uniref:Uncharacterized protein n=1 Tax=Bifidobacterium leontopitheci TaxID=2650774 RepID=A0A6I1GLP9_9BIFI|nr:hypothetical protein [Bifidobacterium leontopitheci]KAB7790287.1 hypothetical protein F7D09_1183 [Bifidobacterium leontopitheci]
MGFDMMHHAVTTAAVAIPAEALSAWDRFVVWYGELPAGVKTVISLVLGAIVAYIAFKIVIRLIKGIVSAIIAAVLAFLLTTVPGNLLLNQAYDRVQDELSGITSQLK